MADRPPEAGLRGVRGEEVRQVDAGGLGMWVSNTDVGPASVEGLREHEQVVRWALRSATPLPLRFGTVFGDDDQVRRSLTARETEYLGILARVEGKVEMSVRVAVREEDQAFPREPDAPPRETAISPGRAHLEARRRALAADTSARRRIIALLDAVEAELADLDVPMARSIMMTDAPFGTLAHLVRREDVRAYRDRIAQIQLRRSDLVLAASGPWAPYSFIG